MTVFNSRTFLLKGILSDHTIQMSTKIFIHYETEQWQFLIPDHFCRKGF